MKHKIVLAFLVLVLALVMVTPVFAFPGHQAAAADLRGDVAELVPGHVARAHQAIAAELRGAVADLVPGHVRP